MSNILEKIKSYGKLPKEEWFKTRIEKCLACPLNSKNGAEVKGTLKVLAGETVVSSKYGQCSLCGCPTERKASIKAESCPKDPKEWDTLEVIGRGSISDYFALSAITGVKSIAKSGGTFIVEAEDTNSNLFVELEVVTSFKGKSEKFIPGCASCTKGRVEDLGNNKYKIQVKIKKEDFGYHRVTFTTVFNRDGVAGKLAFLNLNVQINFNKIQK